MIVKQLQDLLATIVRLRVENTTTALLAQWLVKQWPQGWRINADGQVRPISVWQWPLGDPRGRRLEVLPLRVVEESSTKVVLAARVLEYETDLPQPETNSREYTPGDPQRLVIDNPRGVEVTLWQIELAAVEVTALCTTTVLLGSYTTLLSRLRQVYSPSLRLMTAHIGRMDGLHGEGVFLWHRLDGVLFEHYAGELAALLKKIDPSWEASNQMDIFPTHGEEVALPQVMRERLEYIRANYRDKTDAEMGQALSLDADTVKKMRLAHGLRKRKPRQA